MWPEADTVLEDKQSRSTPRLTPAVTSDRRGLQDRVHRCEVGTGHSPVQTPPSTVCVQTSWTEQRPQTSAPTCLYVCLSVWMCMFTGCPGVTATGIKHLGRLSKLRFLGLYDLPAGVIPATMLDNLHGCTGLEYLYLGHRERPLETAIPAAAVSRSVSRHWPVCVSCQSVRLVIRTHQPTRHRITKYSEWWLPEGSLWGVTRSNGSLKRRSGGDYLHFIITVLCYRLAVACRKLYRLFLHTTVANSQAVLDALHAADLGSDSDGRPRTFRLWVPGR